MLKQTFFAACVTVALLASSQAMAEPQFQVQNPHAQHQPGKPVPPPFAQPGKPVPPPFAQPGKPVPPPAAQHNNGGQHGQDAPKVDVAKALMMQDRLIDEGVRKGELTRDEVSSLRKEQSRIKKADRALHKQGLTRDEAKKLEKMLERAKQHIAAECNDRERVKKTPAAPSHNGHQSAPHR